MEMTHKQILDHLKVRRENLLEIKDLRDVADGGFGIADNLMKHAALFEIDQMIKHIEDFEKV